MKQIVLPWSEAKVLIQEGDVLLFRAKESFISKVISSQTQTPYCHVGVASWVNGSSNTQEGQLECVEFREGKGGRAINLHRAVIDHPQEIDVYRPIPVFAKLKFNPETKQTELIRKEFKGKLVTRIMREMTGLPYGWRRIWWLFKQKLVFIRLMNDSRIYDETLSDIIYPVCSTSANYSFARNDYNLLNNRNSEYIEPGHIAQSSRLNYLFTLGI